MLRGGVGIPEKDLSLFRRALLSWYGRHRRDLPWRRTRDPYHIWISEIMLQQTRVAAVLEHYRLFLKRFPDIEALASASGSAVLAAWSGLGYYRRARMLHQCAHRLVSGHRTTFPRDSETLRALPGIGPYTAAAIASIAFDEAVAVVDGNVERVTQRIVGEKLSRREIWTLAQTLLSRSRPGDFNQAMMELGAMICTPQEPKCGICPLWKWCRTRGVMPHKIPNVPQRRKEVWCALDRRDGHIRLIQRSNRSSLMAGMWELPQASKLPDRLSSAHWRTFRHSITVTDYKVHVIREALADTPRGRWIALDDLPDLPLTGLTRKILRADGII
jgi:A/G-specific adenine glycosylase